MIFNMGAIRQERPNESPILNFNKRLYSESLNKKFATLVKKSKSLRTWKNKQCLEKINSASFLEIKLLAENHCGGEKFSTSQKLKVSYSHKIFGIQSETSLLINYGKFANKKVG